jgi:hypothetical protein
MKGMSEKKRDLLIYIYFLYISNNIFDFFRFKIFKDADKAMSKKGILEGLSTIKYKLLQTKRYNLFTIFRVNFNRKKILADWKKKFKTFKL